MASTPKADGSDNVIAAARHIVRSLATTSEAADDMMRILSAFDHRLSTVPDLFSSFPSGDEEDASGSPVDEVEPPSSCAEPSETEARLKAAERVILHWDPSRPDSLLWDSPETAADYLAAVDEVIALAEGNSLDGAEETLQIAIARLGDEFRNLMIQNADVLDSENLQESIKRLSISFRSASANAAPEDVGESPLPDQPLATQVNTMCLSDEQISNLICPEAISDLRDIADRMIKAGYRNDLCRVYTSVRCNILGDCLSLLGAGAVSNKEVRSMEWTALDHKMKMWIQAVKLSVEFMSAERQLCQQIIAASDDLREECFDEVAKFCVMQLLKFGDAIAEGQRSTERLFRTLDMFEALAGVFPDIQVLFLGDSKDNICEGIQSVLSRLGETIKNTLAEFGNMIQGKTSKKALPGGEIHPLNGAVDAEVEHNVAGGVADNRQEEGWEPAGFSVGIGVPTILCKLRSHRMSLGDQAFFLLAFIACTTSVAFASFVIAAIPTLIAMKRAAISRTRLADTSQEELPSTMVAIRLSGMEISDLTLELSDLSQDIAGGINKSAQAVQASEAGIRQIGSIAKQQTVSLIQERANLPDISLKPMVEGAAKKISHVVGQAKKTLMSIISGGESNSDGENEDMSDKMEM